MTQDPLVPAAAEALGLWYFQTDPRSIKASVAAGIGAFMVDWENKAKVERQTGRDTEINFDTAEDLVRSARVPGAKAICRINGSFNGTRAEIETAIESGASALLLPMVRTVAEVERFLRWVDGRVAAGILVETGDAVAIAADLARLPLSAVYVGLNDLCISQGRANIFETLADGTVERVVAAMAAEGVPCGWGGVTVIDRGAPIPCRLLMAELRRTGGRFCFLRRSFRRDIEGLDLGYEVGRIREAWRDLGARSLQTVEDDRRQLIGAIQALGAP